MMEQQAKILFLQNSPDYVKHEYIDLNKTYETLRKQWGIQNCAVYKVICSLGLNKIKIKDKITSCDESKFSLDDPIFCYYPGLIATGGYYDIKYHRVIVQMSAQALEVLQYLSNYFNVSSGVRTYYKNGGYSNGCTVYDFTISQKKLFDIINTYAKCCRKEDSSRIIQSKYLKQMKPDCLMMYFRGLWDGDGTIMYQRAGSILEIHEDMVNDIQSIIDITGLDVEYQITQSTLGSGKTAYTLQIPINKGLKNLYNWMYNGYLDCCIAEKYQK